MKDATYFTRNPTSEVETDPIVLVDDDISSAVGWMEGNGGGAFSFSLGDDAVNKIFGSNCLAVTKSAGGSDISCLFNIPLSAEKRNWSQKDYYSFYWYGLGNTGDYYYFYISTDSWSNRRGISIEETWNGWKRIVLPFQSMTLAGSFNIANVTHIGFDNIYGAAKFDRFTTDVFPAWATAEVAQVQMKTRGVPP